MGFKNTALNLLFNPVGIFEEVGKGIKKAAGGGERGGPPSPTPMPQAPTPVDASAKGEELARRKRAAQTKTVYTSPLGIAGEAQVVRKTLLGQ